MTSPRHRQPSLSFLSGMADSELFDSSFFYDAPPLGARVVSSHTTPFTLPLDWSNHASSGLTIDGRAEAQGMANPIPTTTPLSQTQRDTVATGLNSIRSSLSFLVGLHPSEKQRLLKMGNKNRAFTEDAIQAGIANPGMLPRSIDPETLQGSLALYASSARSKPISSRSWRWSITPSPSSVANFMRTRASSTRSPRRRHRPTA